MVIADWMAENAGKIFGAAAAGKLLYARDA